MPQLRRSLFATVLTAAAAAAAAVRGDGDDSNLLLSFTDASVDTFQWMAENDPVMGGVSTSNVTVVEGDHLAWQGECKIVPSLAAPGFCIAQVREREEP